jgi:molybdopterin converting factor small subunit
MNGSGNESTNLRAVVADKVVTDFEALCAEVDKMRPSGVKTELEEFSLKALRSVVDNVREAASLADTLRAAHVYHSLVDLLVVKKTRSERRETIEKNWQGLREVLYSYERTEVLVAAELRQLAADIEEKLANSTVVQKIKALTDQLRSSNEKLEQVVINISASNGAMADAISATDKRLSAIHHTLAIFSEEMIGPVTRKNARTTEPGPETAGTAPGTVTKNRGTGGAG